jgi:hypothetical protein
LTTIHGFGEYTTNSLASNFDRATDTDLAADNALSFDVITTSGEYLTVNEEKNPDLFWGLKGGGPSTFAVVLSVTLKTHPELASAGATLYINNTHTTNETQIWEGVRIFHKYSNHFVDNGLYVYFEIAPMSLRARPFVAFGKNATELDAILAPMISELKVNGIPYETVTKSFSTVYNLYIDLFEDEGAGGFALTGGWMFSRKDVAENNNGIIEAFKKVINPREDLQNSGFMVGHLWNAGYGMPISNSATHPAFRNASDLVIAILPVPPNATIAQKEDLQNVLSNIQDPALRKAGPNGCAYGNEVSFWK